MPKSKQTYLGASSTQTLCLFKPARSPPIEGEELTSSLPDELLAEILEYFAPRDWHERKTASFLLFMSRRWKRLYEPFHYRYLDMGSEGFDKEIRVVRLLKTLKTRPELCKHVRHVPIFMYKAKPSSCQLASEMLGLCNELCSISMNLQWLNITPNVVDALPKLHRLESLDLFGQNGGPSLATILRISEPPRLKSLTLDRYGVGRLNELGAEWPRGVSASTSDLEMALPTKYHRTGLITKLTLCDPACDPNVSQLVAR